MPKEFPYKTSFSFLIKPVVSEEKDKYLASASIQQLKPFLPDIDTEVNHDLLPIAFNACVVNRVNKNDDVINTQTAVAIYKNFINKQINIEHKRTNVIGVILTAGFSEFGTDKPLTEEQVKTMTGPFNITLGGILWRVVNGELAEFVEESSDPTSSSYLGISASWELGFTDYQLVSLPDNQKNIEAGQTFALAEDINKYKEKLRTLGGNGMINESTRIYRMPSEGVTPLGIGLTERPAAEVEGVITPEKKQDDVSAEEVTKALVEINQQLRENASEKQNNISQVSKTDVNIERNINMKINTLNDITDDNLKQITASAITDFISSEFSVKSKEWEAEQNKLNNQITQATEDYKKLSDEHAKVQESLKAIQATVDALNAEKLAREEVEKFNTRMGVVTEAFELDDEARAAIVEEVKALASEEAFEKWMTKANVLLKAFAKKKKFLKPEEKKEEVPFEEKEEKSKASTESTASVVEDAINNAEPEKANITNSTATSQTFREKYSSAFAMDAFEIKYKR